MSSTRLMSLLLTAALAQGAQASQPIEEILVTAQKREQNIEDVPFSITAIGPDAIERRDIADIGAIGPLVPNLQVTSAPGGSSSAQVAIRGGITINPALTWETTVGLYLDGVYIGKAQGSLFDAVDIERIEVLRGPQGTLYGRNTLAGGINIVSRAPSGELSGQARAGAGNLGRRLFAASIDLPAIGAARINLSGRKEHRDGWVEVNDARGFPPSSVGELGEADATALRAALDLDIGERASLSYRFDYSEQDQAASHSQLHRLDFDFGLPLSGFIAPEREDQAAVDGPSFERSEVSGHALTLTLDLNDALSLKSTTARRDLSWSDALDLDGSPIDVAHTQRHSDYDSFSQEIQLLGARGPMNFVAGLYYFEDDGFTDNPQRFFGAFGPFGLTFVSRYGFETEAIAAYAQVDWAITDALTLTGGLRYTDEKKQIQRELGFPGVPRTIPADTEASTSFDDTTPVVSLAYALSDTTAAYVRYAEGFKSGGFNGEAQTVAETVLPYRSETVRSIEAGIKGAWLENRLRASAAVFQNDHEDMQLSVFTAEGAAGSSVRNAGEARIRGFELEASLQATDALRIAAGYGHLDPEYDEFLDCGGRVDVADNRAFPHAPEHSFNATLDARLARGGWGELAFLLDYSRFSKHYLYPFPIAPDSNPACAPSALAPATEVGDYGLANARLTLSNMGLGNGTTLSATLWAKNIGDKQYRANMIDFGPGFASLTTAYYGLPRTYGFDLTLQW